VTRKRISPWLLLILLCAWALLTLRIGSAWFGHQDANGAWISVAVRNYQLHGFFLLGGSIDRNTDLTGGVVAYTHHPPLMVWLSALPALLVGYDETLIRWVAACCTMLGASALYVLARRLNGTRFAMWGAAFYLLTPMTAYFGRMPDHEAPALMFVLLFAAVLAEWPRRPTRARWWALLALGVLTAWTAWGGLIVVVALGAGALAVSRRRAPLLVIGAAVAASVVVMYGYYLIFAPDAITDLISVWVWRTSTSSLDPGSVPFTAAQFVTRILMRLHTLYTPSMLIIALVGVPVVVRRGGWLRIVLAALLAAGFGYTLIFPNAAYIHDYYLIYTAPGLAMLAAAGVTLLPGGAPRWLRPVTVGLALVALPTSLYYLASIYRTADSTLGLEFARVVHDHTAPGDLIMSNVPSIGLAPEFYAERAIHWQTMPADALAAAQRADRPAFYLQCDSYPTLPPGTPELSRVEVVPECVLTRLR
jgi:hypothetical protein